MAEHRGESDDVGAGVWGVPSCSFSEVLIDFVSLTQSTGSGTWAPVTSLWLNLDVAIVVVQAFCCVQLFVTLWTAARQASLSTTNS